MDTASTPESFAAWEVEHETGAITVTDHGTLAGARKVYDLATGKKFKGKLSPILGLEAYFRDDHCPILAAHGVAPTQMWRTPDGKAHDVESHEGHSEELKKASTPFQTYLPYLKYMHLTMHFLDQPAYEAGIKILSKADDHAEQHGVERKPLFGWAELEQLGAYNITFTSGCLIGMVQRHLVFANRPDIATAYYERLRGCVKPGNFYVEAFPHVCDRNWSSKLEMVFEDGTTETFRPGKILMTDRGQYGRRKSGTGGTAEDLHAAWGRSKDGHGCLRAVMEDRKWVERPVAKKIVDVRINEDFLMNECTAFSPNGDLQAPANRFVMELAAKHGDPVLISDDSHFVNPEDKIIQDIKLMQSGDWRFATSYHRFTGDMAAAYFTKVMGMSDTQVEALADNNRAWASRFKDFKLTNRPSLPTSFYPKDTLAHTWKLIQQHGRHGLLRDPKYGQRLKDEIRLLHLNGTIDLLPYFFIDEEVCEQYQSRGELTGPGRGSAAGLLLAYLLEITHADPLRHGLSKDRFLTLDRIQTGKLPDIDQDLPSRDILVDPKDGSKGWLRERFGDCVVQISTDRSIKLKSAILDVHRVLSSDRRVPAEVATLAHKMPNPPQGISDKDFVFGYDANGVWEEGIVNTDANLMHYVETYPKEWAIVQKCLGIPAGKGRHACGYVIANEPISNFIPTMTVGGYLVTQPSAAQVESSGGLKMDFLNINSLKDISSCINLIQQRHSSDLWAERFHEGPGQKVGGLQINDLNVPLHRCVPLKGGGWADIWDLPEDQPVFHDISAGNTESVFQFGTPGAQKWLKHFNHVRPTTDGVVHKALDSIETLAAFTALDRPGPLDALVEDPATKQQHNMLVEFARRARGERAIGSFPILNKLFPETYGVLVYQEQVQRAFHEVGKTTAIQANDFRVHVSKKQMKEILADKAIFMPGAIETIGEESAEILWKSMETFGQYAFNKSHAVCYVIIGYACAWLKHHYPLEWWTSVLRHAKKEEIEQKFWRHCGPLINLPDISLSGDEFQIVGNRIQAPLNMVLGLGPIAHAELIKYRPVSTVKELCQKIDDRRVAEGEKTTKMKKRKGGYVEPVTTVKKASSALNMGIFSKLLTIGAMDSLLPEEVRGASIAQKIEYFIDVNSTVTGDRYVKTGLPKEQVKEEFRNLTEAQQYQLKKSLLPAYTMPLAHMIPPDLLREVTDKYGRKIRVLNTPGKTEYTIVTPEGLRFWMAPTKGNWPRGFTVNLAVPCYVTKYEVKRYHDTKERAVIDIDVDGLRAQFVRWPGDDGKLDPFWRRNLTGALLVLALQKWNPEKDFTVAEGAIISLPPVVQKKEKKVKKNDKPIAEKDRGSPESVQGDGGGGGDRPGDGEGHVEGGSGGGEGGSSAEAAGG